MMNERALEDVVWPRKDTPISWHLWTGLLTIDGDVCGIRAQWLQPGDERLADLTVALSRRVLRTMGRAEAHVFIRDSFLYQRWPQDVPLPGEVIAAFLTLALGEPPLERIAP